MSEQQAVMEELTAEQREVLAPFFDDYAIKFSKYRELKAQLHELSKEMHEAWELSIKAKRKLEEETLELLNGDK